jgi:hypothetical protein
MKNKISILTFSVFSGYGVHIELTKDLVKTISKYEDTKDIPLSMNTEAICIEIDKGISYMFLPYNPTPDIIAHESWHAVKNMMEFVGINLDSETVAYHLGFVVNEVHKLRRKK